MRQPLLLLAVLALPAPLFGQGLGGVLKVEVKPEKATACGRPPLVFRAGTLVAFGSRSLSDIDWTAPKRKDGAILASFRIKDQVSYQCAWVPETAVEFFEWSCGGDRVAPGLFNPVRISCSPMAAGTGTKADWNFRFVLAGRKAATAAGVPLVESVPMTDFAERTLFISAPASPTPAPDAPAEAPTPAG